MGIFKRIPVRARIALGLVGLTVGTLLIASAGGFFPNEQKEILRGRAKFCEALAIASTGMASTGQLKTLKATMNSLVNRDEDVSSIGLRTDNDGLIASAGPHEYNWIAEAGNSVAQMEVPVYRKGQEWGHLEICFVGTGGFLGLNYWAPAWLLIVMIPALFIQFSFYLRKTLKHLDPSDRVPQHVQDALDTLSVGLLLLDGSNRILYGNSELASSIDRDADDLLGVDVSTMGWETSEEQHELPWLVAARTGQAVHDEILYKNVGDRRRTYSVNCSKVGKGVMATFDDITLLEEARLAAQQANESKSAFLANMSHEIRTPLNAVLGFTDVLRRGLVTDTEESFDHLNMIHRSGKHLLELINDILDLSKIEAGKMDVERIDTQVDQIVLDTVDVLGVRARERELDLNVEFHSAIPRVIQSDPTRLKQVIVNLVGNAIKFTEEGSVTIATTLVEEESLQLRIDIIDTGIGMTPEQQDKIFDSFSQADETTTRKFGGTGLGLSISRRLSEAMGGELSVSSEQGVGSTFTVTLPVDPAALEEMISAEEILSRHQADNSDSASSEITRLASKPVLVVDDGEANRRLIELVLGRAGAVVTAAENGLEAIKAVAETDFALIFMDMQMPVMDGYTAIGKMRSVGLKTPIIALTGNAMKGDREKCINAGCDDFLSKPVDIDKLLQRAAHYLGKAKAVTPNELPHPSENRVAPVTATSSPPVAPACGQPVRSTLPMDDEEFREIVIDFVERLDARLDAITTALEAADFETVRADAHWLKGAGGTVGFCEFTDPAAALESAAKQSDADVAANMLQTIKEIHARVDVPGWEKAATPNPQPDSVAAPEAETTSSPASSSSGPPIACDLPLDDPEFCEIVSDFVDRLDDRLEQMGILCDGGQFGVLAKEAHWLKGSGGTVGYGEFSEPAAALEKAAKQGAAEAAQSALAEIISVRQRIIVPDRPQNTI